jgi:hypothetical protein
MPVADQYHELDSSHSERTDMLLSKEFQEQMNIISFILDPATMKELTNCHIKNARN